MILPPWLVDAPKEIYAKHLRPQLPAFPWTTLYLCTCWLVMPFWLIHLVLIFHFIFYSEDSWSPWPRRVNWCPDVGHTYIWDSTICISVPTAVLTSLDCDCVFMPGFLTRLWSHGQTISCSPLYLQHRPGAGPKQELNKYLLLNQ